LTFSPFARIPGNLTGGLRPQAHSRTMRKPMAAQREAFQASMLCCHLPQAFLAIFWKFGYKENETVQKWWPQRASKNLRCGCGRGICLARCLRAWVFELVRHGFKTLVYHHVSLEKWFLLSWPPFFA
jgi:hypothetical protein